MKRIKFDILVTLLRKMGIGKNNDGDVKSAIEVFRELQDEFQMVKDSKEMDEESVENHYEEMFGTLGEVFGKNVKDLIGYI